MGKRKLGHVNNPIEIVSTPPKAVDDVSKHRTCWKHVLAYFHAHKMKMYKKEIRSLESTAPCFLGTFPQRKRSSPRRVSRKNAVFRQKKKLDSLEFECYLENLWRSFSEDERTSFTYLDSLWFHLYMKASNREKVLTWIKRKHIFSKKYVFVPIVCWSHWSLLIFCHFGESMQSKTKTPCMLLLDSLAMANPRRLEPEIRKFVLDIYKAENRPETKELIYRIPFLVPKVPQQRNDVECGNFVLYFIHLFLKCAPENFNIKGYPYFMEKNWFSQQGLECFCERLNSYKTVLL